MNEEQIARLSALADAADRGETEDLSGLTDEQYLTRLRLQQLHEEFESKRDGHVEYWAWNWTVDEWAEDEEDESDWSVAACHAARHYIIARDFGEFDRERALMLWKLQNGGAL